MKNNKTTKIIRYILLAIILIIVTIKSHLHQVLGGGKSPSIHALCPYGALESFYTLIFSGNFIQKIFLGTFILLILTLIIALIFRRSFCGLICPFGALQEFFGLLGQKIFKKRFIMPKSIDKPLRYLKYIILVITLYFAWATSGLWINPYDPWAAYGHITTGISSLLEEYPFGFTLLVIVLIGSLLYDRFFCKYLCPMGAFYGLISKISATKIIRNEDTCIKCGLCSKICPVNIKVAEISEVTSFECINCNKCVLSCPKKGALEVKTIGKTIKPLTIIIIVFCIFFGGLLITNITGIYQTTPEKITYETKLTPEEIKGYMTLEELSIGFNINLDELYKKLDIPENVPKDTKLKDVKNFAPNFEVEKVREILK